MPLKRISEQPSRSIEEYYNEIATQKDPASIPERGKAMLALIQLLNKTFQDRVVWALTSIDRLILLAEDKSNSQWFVKIATLGFHEFYIEYSMPNDKSPWPNAWISGMANSVEKARDYVLIAMKESRGWVDI